LEVDVIRVRALAGLLAVVGTVALASPVTADPAPPTFHYVVTSACPGGGQNRLVARSDGVMERDRMVLSGVKRSLHWHVNILQHMALAIGGPPLDAPPGKDYFAGSGHRDFVPKHGVAGQVAWAPVADEVDTLASASPADNDRAKWCDILLQGTPDNLAIGSEFAFLGLQSSFTPPRVTANIDGTVGHRYRFDVTLRTKAGLQHRTAVRGTTPSGQSSTRFHTFKGLRTVREASLTITDLRRHKIVDEFRYENLGITLSHER
jgi:hypothetical protein